jgi:hypothetical protein
MGVAGELIKKKYKGRKKNDGSEDDAEKGGRAAH